MCIRHSAPHRRDRVWFVAHSNERNDRRAARKDEGESGAERIQEWDAVRQFVESGEVRGNAPDTDNELRQGRDESTKERRQDKGKRAEPLGNNQPRRGTGNWQNFPTEPPICSGDDGLSDRLDNITFPKWRNESIKAYGNAIVPQVAHQIFKAIEAYEESLLRRPQG